MTEYLLSLAQECLGVIRKLCTEEAAGAELTDKLTENLKETLCDNKVSVIIIKSVMLGS